MDSRHLLYWDNDPRQGERLITMIGGQPFYRSSGQNSGMDDTFFPFSGFGEDTRFIKPFESSTDLKNRVFDLYFPLDLVDVVKQVGIGDVSKVDLNERAGGFLARMGNLHGLILSMSIGGGVWAASGGIKLAIYLYEHYRPPINQLQKQHQPELNAIIDEIQCSKEMRKGLSCQIVMQQANSGGDDANQKQITFSEMNRELACSRSNQDENKLFEVDENGKANKVDYSLPLSFKEAKQRLAVLNKCYEKVATLLAEYHEALPDHAEKKDIIKRALDILQKERDAKSVYRVTAGLEKVEKILTKGLSKLAEHRDPVALKILKLIGHVLSMGIVSKLTRNTFAFWKTNSEVVAEKTLRKIDKAKLNP